MDSSGSVGKDNFITMKAFVKSIINNLDIGPDLTRVGVITYSRYPSIRLHLNEFYNKTEIDNAVDAIPYIAGKLYGLLTHSLIYHFETADYN